MVIVVMMMSTITKTIGKWTVPYAIVSNSALKLRLRLNSATREETSLHGSDVIVDEFKMLK